MTLSFSSDVYTEMVQVQQAQIQALQNKVQELEARIEVWSSNQFYLFKTNLYYVKNYFYHPNGPMAGSL
jgi:hypothetical protein